MLRRTSTKNLEPMTTMTKCFQQKRVSFDSRRIAACITTVLLDNVHSMIKTTMIQGSLMARKASQPPANVTVF